MHRTMWTKAALVACAVLIPAPAAAQLGRKPALTLEAGRRIAAAAEARARANGWNVVVAVVDDGGHLILLERMDDTQTASVEIAIEKARSAAAFRRPTRVMAEWVTGGSLTVLGLPGAVPVEGGVPLVVGGQVIGAIGVSGATAREDGQVAQAGADALQRLAGS